MGAPLAAGLDTSAPDVAESFSFAARTRTLCAREGHMTTNAGMTVLVFGATGSAGGSVLRACLASDAVAEVRAVTRRPPSVSHDKLRIVIHDDFLEYSKIAETFAGVDACLFCLGVSATQVDETTYRKVTHDFALAAARALRAASPDAAFHYVSGTGTRADSRFNWARVKAETESALSDLVGAVSWRPAFIDGETSASFPRLLRVLRPLFRLLRPFDGLYVAGEDLGLAMLQATRESMRRRVIENAEIRAIAARARASGLAA
jgi:uncharacterized protein YbjT (DUF2867 family)